MWREFRHRNYIELVAVNIVQSASNRLSGALPLLLIFDCENDGAAREAEKSAARREVGPRETLAFVAGRGDPGGGLTRSVLCVIVMQEDDDGCLIAVAVKWRGSIERLDSTKSHLTTTRCPEPERRFSQLFKNTPGHVES